MAETMSSSDMIIRRVRVNRSLTPQQVLDATGRKQYTDSPAIACMPKGVGEEVEICFFRLKMLTSDPEVEQALARHGLVTDPDAQAQLNAEDPSFARVYPNYVVWKDKNGKWYQMLFRWFHNMPVVFARISCGDLDEGCWVAGSRPVKPSVA